VEGVLDHLDVFTFIREEKATGLQLQILANERSRNTSQPRREAREKSARSRRSKLASCK